MVTTSIKEIKQTLRRGGEQFINRDDLAEALANRNLFRLTTTIKEVLRYPDIFKWKLPVNRI